MSTDYDNEETDRFLVEAAIILADKTGLMPDLLDAVASPTLDAAGTEGKGLCQGLPHGIALVSTYNAHKSPLVFHHLGFARVNPVLL